MTARTMTSHLSTITNAPLLFQARSSRKRVPLMSRGKPPSHFSGSCLSLAGFEQFLDVQPDAFGDFAAAAGARMRHMPFDPLLARRPGRHAVEAMPFPVQRHGAESHIPLTTFSVTFLASPSSIMVLSR